MHLRPSPTQYEQLVKDFLKRKTRGSKVKITISGKRKHTASVGTDEYELDGTAKFELMGGQFSVIVECKRYKRNVDRDEVIALHGKMQEVAFHKAMMFATSGFQTGAISYARKHGIALFILRSTRFSSITKSERSPSAEESLQYEVWWVSLLDDSDIMHLVDSSRLLAKAFKPDMSIVDA
jgi:restriction system protein